RLGLARHVGMPDLAGRHRGGLVGMHDADFGMAVDLGPGGGMDQQLAEQPAESHVLLDAHLLVAEEDHLMRHQGMVQLARLAVRQRLAEVDAEDFRTDGGCQLVKAQSHWQLPTLGGASSTVATLEMSRQRVPIQPLPCTRMAKRAKVSACCDGV